MNKYYKNGNTVLPQEQIELEWDGVKYFNPPEEVLLAAGWVEVIYDEIHQKYIYGKKVQLNSTLRKLNKYDKSINVNSFFIGDTQTWIDRDTRVSLMNSTNILKQMGQETTTLWLGDQPYTLACDSVIQMLSALEVYALQCYNVTAQHRANINSLETIEEIIAYDFKTGYPEKLVFNV